MWAKSHHWNVDADVEGLLHPDCTLPNVALHCGELFCCQEGFLDHGEHLFFMVANIDVAWDRSHYDELSVQNMCLCPWISQRQCWQWDMVFYIFPDIDTSPEASHIQWLQWAWLPFLWNCLSFNFFTSSKHAATTCKIPPGISSSSKLSKSCAASSTDTLFTRVSKSITSSGFFVVFASALSTPSLKPSQHPLHIPISSCSTQYSKDPVPFQMQKHQGMETEFTFSIWWSDPLSFIHIYDLLWKQNSIGWHPSAAFFQFFLFCQAFVKEPPLYSTNLVEIFFPFGFGRDWS